jgi:type 1 glutamine amidotransferase
LHDVTKLAQYQIFLVDYNGTMWDEDAKRNFEQAVSNGTGVVFIHASNNSFSGWTAYEQMLGLAWGEHSGHGDFHEFEVKFSETEHPITKGLSNYKVWDELYHQMVPMHGVPYQVLATAYSDPETKGTGLHEPIMLALQYGKGRIFHQLLGHVWPDDYGGAYKGATMVAVENTEFVTCLIRGYEWAATGAVS